MRTLAVASDPLAGPVHPEPTGIKFTQHLMPHGRLSDQWIDNPPEIAPAAWDQAKAKAADIVAAGYSFHMELLPNWTDASLSVVGPDEIDLVVEVVENGPAVPGAVIALIDKAYHLIGGAQ